VTVKPGDFDSRRNAYRRSTNTFQGKGGIRGHDALLHRGWVSKSKESIPTGRFRGHTLGNVLLNTHLNVRRQLGFDFAINFGACKQIRDAAKERHRISPHAYRKIARTPFTILMTGDYPPRKLGMPIGESRRASPNVSVVTEMGPLARAILRD
jgi:hypothetical protein